MNDTIKKALLGVGALVLAFAAGRYTMRAATKTEVEKEYELKYSEKLAQLETSIKEEFRQTTESVRKSVEENSTKLATIEEKITVTPDGIHVVERKKSTSEVKKSKSTTKKKSKTTEKAKEQVKTEIVREIVKEEVIKEVTVTIPPPSWRVYGAAALDDVTGKRQLQYGAGAQYDFGPVNVGGLGLYRPEDSAITVGITAGVSF